MIYRNFSSLAALAACVLPVLASPKPSPSDGKLMQGAWTPSSWVFMGSPTPPPGMSAMRLTMKDGKYEFVEGPTHDIGRITLHPDQTPKAMDIAGTKGPNAGKKIPAIYRFEGDHLTICYGLDGHRPTAFESPKRSVTLLIVFIRTQAVRG